MGSIRADAHLISVNHLALVDRLAVLMVGQSNSLIIESMRASEQSFVPRTLRVAVTDER